MRSAETKKKKRNEILTPNPGQHSPNSALETNNAHSSTWTRRPPNQIKTHAPTGIKFKKIPKKAKATRQGSECHKAFSKATLYRGSIRLCDVRYRMHQPARTSVCHKRTPDFRRRIHAIETERATITASSSQLTVVAVRFIRKRTPPPLPSKKEQRTPLPQPFPSRVTPPQAPTKQEN